MPRSAIVTNYAFTATNGTNVSALNSGSDWTEQNANNGQLRVNPDAGGSTANLYGNEFANFADCCYKGTGVGSFTTNQYAEVTLGGAVGGNNDKIGIALLDNGGGFSAFSAYRIYLFDTSTGSTNEAVIDRIINGTVTNLATFTNLTWSVGDKLSCEVTITGGNPTLQIYQDTGSGPVAVGTPTTDTGGLTSGVPGVTGAKSTGLMLGGPWTAGNLVAPPPSAVIAWIV